MSEHDEQLLSEVELIEAQPLADRARAFEQMYEQLLNELQRSDTGVE